VKATDKSSVVPKLAVRLRLRLSDGVSLEYICMHRQITVSPDTIRVPVPVLNCLSIMKCVRWQREIGLFVVDSVIIPNLREQVFFIRLTHKEIARLWGKER